jgi:hypothetical protein
MDSQSGRFHLLWNWKFRLSQTSVSHSKYFVVYLADDSGRDFKGDSMLTIDLRRKLYE